MVVENPEQGPVQDNSLPPEERVNQNIPPRTPPDVQLSQEGQSQYVAVAPPPTRTGGPANVMGPAIEPGQAPPPPGPSPIESAAAAGYADIQTGIGDLFQLGVQAGAGINEVVHGQPIGGNLSNFQSGGIPFEQAQQTAESTAPFIPGASILKGIGESGAPLPERVFDVGAGALIFVPGIGEVPTAVKAGAGAAFGAAGSLAYGNTNPENIGESAAIGALTFGLGGKLIGKAFEEPTPPQEFITGTGGEQIPLQPGSPAPVAGGEVTELGQSVIPPRDVSMMLEDIEGRLPTKGGTYTQGLETEEPNVTQPSVHAGGPPKYEADLPGGPTPYGGNVTPYDYAGRSITPPDYTPAPARESAFPPSKGGSATGITGGSYGGGQATELEVVRYPPGAQVPQQFETFRFSEVNVPQASLFETPGETPTSFPVSSPAFERAPAGAVAIIPSTDVGVGEIPGTGPLQVPGQAQIQIPQQTPAQVPQQFETGGSTAPSAFSFPTPNGSNFGTFFPQAPGDRHERRRKLTVFGFREIKHPYLNLLTLEGPSRGRGKRKK